MLFKRVVIILIIVAGILLIPLVAMQFTNEVNWTIFDFVVAGILLYASGLMLEFNSRKIQKRSRRIIL